MSIGIASYIAGRFMLARKRRRSVGVVTGVSIAGIAVATLAMVCVLSVYNGFDALLGSQLSSLSPDVKVESASGKTLDASTRTLQRIAAIDGVESVAAEIEDNALAMANDRQYPVRVRGVDPAVFGSMTSIGQMIMPGGKYQLDNAEDTPDDEEFDFEGGGNSDIPQTATTVAGIGAAANLGATPGAEITIYAPRRIGRVSLANPAEAFTAGGYRLAGVFKSDQKDFDADEMLVNIDEARRLFQYTDEATSIDIKLKDGSDAQAICRKVEEVIPGTTAKDRLQQHALNFRMINIEKWVTFLLLAFILIVASFNVISSVSMLALEKKEGLTTLYSLGLTRRNIGSIFIADSMYVMLCGGLIGILVGVGLCLLQQHFGLIRLNANAESLIIQAYPVRVKWSDLLLILAPLCAIGLTTGAVASGYARSLLNR